MSIEARSLPEKVKFYGDIFTVAIAFLGFITGNANMFASAALDGAVSTTIGKRIVRFFGKNKES